MGKTVLFVGDHMEADLMERPLRRAGVTLHSVFTVKDATEYLRKQKGKLAETALLVQSNLPVISLDDLQALTPETDDLLAQFRGIDTSAVGESFVRGARRQGLLPNSMLVCMMSAERPNGIPEGFTHALHFTESLDDYQRLIAVLSRQKRPRA
jgi:hypothetical protein